jgi:hypothetical protein
MRRWRRCPGPRAEDDWPAFQDVAFACPRRGLHRSACERDSCERDRRESPGYLHRSRTRPGQPAPRTKPPESEGAPRTWWPRARWGAPDRGNARSCQRRSPVPRRTKRSRWRRNQSWHLAPSRSSPIRRRRSRRLPRPHCRGHQRLPHPSPWHRRCPADLRRLLPGPHLRCRRFRRGQSPSRSRSNTRWFRVRTRLTMPLDCKMCVDASHVRTMQRERQLLQGHPPR